MNRRELMTGILAVSAATLALTELRAQIASLPADAPGFRRYEEAMKMHAGIKQ